MVHLHLKGGTYPLGPPWADPPSVQAESCYPSLPPSAYPLGYDFARKKTKKKKEALITIIITIIIIIIK
ncbi:hypothetical protein LX36DRAFT_664723 [Colletotrichum falcatum]|nr:hypothetical protein LX36DRAFT_664723 [Colletotrichum falcatum]